MRPETLRRAFTAYTLADGKASPYGYGWFVGKLHGTPLVYHGGNINGFATDAVWLPEERVYVAILANREAAHDDGVALEKLSRQVAMHIAGKPLPVPSGAKLDTATLAGYEGVYPVDDKASLTVRREGDGLAMTRSGMPPLALLHYKPDGFLLGDTLATVEFTRDAGGKVTALTVSGERGVRVHQRMQGAGPVP